MNLQEFWDRGEVPDIGDLCYSSGRVITFVERRCCDIYTFEEKQLCDLGDFGCTIEIYEKIINSTDSSVAYRGSGSMGNTGFLAYSDKKGIVKWTLCLDFSNPFVKFEIQDNVIVAKTEIDYEFFVPTIAPEKMKSISHNKWSY